MDDVTLEVLHEILDGDIDYGIVVALVLPVGEVFHHTHEEIVHTKVHMVLSGYGL